MSPEFLVTSMIVVITPGIGVVYTMGAGLARGTRAGIVAAVACTLGIVPHMVAALTGLAALLYASSLAFEALKLLGVVYLVYLAIATLRDKGALSVDPSPEPRSVTSVIVSGVLINLLNPKLTLFFFAFLPQFISPGDPNTLLQMTGLSLVFMLETLIVFIAYGTFAAAIRRHVISRPSILTWLRRAFAGAFLALGARLALTER